MSFGIHPFIIVAGIGALLAVVSIVLALTVRNKSVKTISVVLALICICPSIWLFLAFHPDLIDGRFRTYKAFYQDIQTGMTKDEVFAVLNKNYPESGARKRPIIMDDQPERLGFFMNPETSREPNCEGIFLTLDHGRVTKKDYSPD